MSNTWEQDLIQEVLLAQVQEQKRRRRWGIFFKLLIVGFIVFSVWQNYKPNVTGPVKHAHTALIEMRGIIGGDEVDADDVVRSLRQAFDQDNAKAVILRIDSPGGSPVHAGYIYDEIMRLRKQKPEKKVYAVIEEVGASAAYYIAAAANDIYANRASIVGSIGVIMPNFGFIDSMKKLGVEQRTMISGDHKSFLDPFSPIKPDEKAFAQALLNTIHQQFIAAVKEGRGERLKADPLLFSGYFWTGEQALGLGLIDGLGSAGSVARDVIGVEDIYDYTISPNWIDRLTHRLGATLRIQLPQWGASFQ
jgi:protease-4